MVMVPVCIRPAIPVYGVTSSPLSEGTMWHVVRRTSCCVPRLSQQHTNRTTGAGRSVGWEGTGVVEDARSGPVATQLRARLSADLRTAMRARDHAATAAIRSLAGALDNAEAVDAPERSSIDPPLVGHGAGEAPRRVLDAATVRSLLDREIIDRDDAVREYRQLGQDDAAERLDAEAAVLRRYVDTWT
jgi:uncharacterized protein YqeY